MLGDRYSDVFYVEAKGSYYAGSRSRDIAPNRNLGSGIGTNLFLRNYPGGVTYRCKGILSSIIASVLLIDLHATCERYPRIMFTVAFVPFMMGLPWIISGSMIIPSSVL